MRKIQLERLRQLVGEKGSLLMTLHNNCNFDLGTKILYLQRAVKQKPVEFNKSLDKLYQNSIQSQERITTLQFISSLKQINNICFNNLALYGGMFMTAIEHYFSNLEDPEINPKDLKAVVRNMIQERIKSMIDESCLESIEQIAKRSQSEENIQGNTIWQFEIELTISQLTQEDPAELEKKFAQFTQRTHVYEKQNKEFMEGHAQDTSQKNRHFLEMETREELYQRYSEDLPLFQQQLKEYIESQLPCNFGATMGLNKFLEQIKSEANQSVRPAETVKVAVDSISPNLFYMRMFSPCPKNTDSSSAAFNYKTQYPAIPGLGSVD